VSIVRKSMHRNARASGMYRGGGAEGGSRGGSLGKGCGREEKKKKKARSPDCQLLGRPFTGL